MSICKHCALLSVILGNVRPLHNKTDELQANATYMHEYRTASILAFTETWLNRNDSYNMLHIDGLGSPLRLHRDTELTGKQHYINKRWCSMIVVQEELCNKDTELLAVSLRPFSPSQRVRSALFHPGLQPLQSKYNSSHRTHRKTLDNLELISPDSPKFILGDFNHCSTDKCLTGSAVCHLHLQSGEDTGLLLWISSWCIQIHRPPSSRLC